MRNKIVLSVVVPVYNEELIVRESYKRLKKVMDSINEPYEIIFVNDGSRDKTSFIVSEICEIDTNIKLIDFSRNFGHQIAITAGMDYSEGDAVVVIDGDLQDPPEVIPRMIEKWREGYDVVYGKRAERKGDSFFKKATAAVFYRFLRKMTDVDIPVDTGDFRLIDRKVCDALKRVHERNRYVRGIISWLGFKQTGV
jgi:glycosyltransferase involved in cell wall biosynthesis